MAQVSSLSPSMLAPEWARRHTEEWIVNEDGITLDECFEAMRTNPWLER